MSESATIGEYLTKSMDDINKIPADTVLDAKKFDEITTRALIKAQGMVDEKGIEGVAQVGRSGIVGEANTVLDDLLENLDKIDIDHVTQCDGCQAGLAKVFNQLKSPGEAGRRIRSGGVHHIRIIRRIGDQVDVIEAKKSVSGAGDLIVDIVKKDGTWVDAKAWTHNETNFRRLFKCGLSPKRCEGVNSTGTNQSGKHSSDMEAEDETKPGQLLKYLAQFCRNDGDKAEFSGVELGFKGASKGREAEISNWLFSEIKAMPTEMRKLLLKSSGRLEGKSYSNDLWGEFVNTELRSKLINMVKVYEQ